MGGTPSKEQQLEQEVKDEQKMAQDIEERKVFISKELGGGIQDLSAMLSQFNQNDTQGILNRIKEMPEFKDKFPNNLMNRVGELHKNILDTIDTSLTNEDKLKEIEKDAGVANYIQKFVDKDMDLKFQSYLDNPYIKNDDVILRSMTDVTNSIKTIRSKYKYFEYKYVQMNIFFILYTNQVQKLVSKFITETSAFYEAREKYNLVLFRNVIKQIQDMFGKESRDLTDLDTTPLSDAMRGVVENTLNNIKGHKDFIDGTVKKANSELKDIIKFFMNNQTEFAQKIVDAADEYRRERPAPAANNPSGSPRSTSERPGIVKITRDAKPMYEIYTGEKEGYIWSEGISSKNEPDVKIQKPGYYPKYFVTKTNKGYEDGEYQVYDGEKDGYEWKNGPNGLGYYLKYFIPRNLPKPDPLYPNRMNVPRIDGYAYTTKEIDRGFGKKENQTAYHLNSGQYPAGRKETEGPRKFIPEIEFERMNEKDKESIRKFYRYQETFRGLRQPGYYLKNAYQYGGSIRDNSLLPSVAFEQQGGFVRDNSFFPAESFHTGGGEEESIVIPKVGGDGLPQNFNEL
jgi:hypothetical protein